MKGKLRIIQTSIDLNSEVIDNRLILIVLNEEKVESVYVIPFPEWHRFYDPKYPFYQFCYN